MRSAASRSRSASRYARRQRPDRGFEVGDAPGRERPAHEPAQRGVLGRIGRQHHRERVALLERDPEARAVRVGVVQRADDVVVARERPESELVVVVAGRVVAQLPVHGKRVVVELVAVRVEPDHSRRLTKGMTNDVDLGSRFLRWERRGATAWVTIDRPERRNALTSNMYFGIRRAVDRVNASRSLHALVVTGTGDVFAPGGELGGQHDDGDLDIGELLGTGAVPFDSIRDSRKPVIAAVNGLCMGGGLLITMLSDVAIASDRATSSARPSCGAASPTRTTPRSCPSTSASRSRATCCSPAAGSPRTRPSGTDSSRASCRTSS